MIFFSSTCVCTQCVRVHLRLAYVWTRLLALSLCITWHVHMRGERRQHGDRQRHKRNRLKTCWLLPDRCCRPMGQLKLAAVAGLRMRQFSIASTTATTSTTISATTFRLLCHQGASLCVCVFFRFSAALITCANKSGKPGVTD